MLLITSRQRMRGIAAVLSFLCFAAVIAGAAGGAPGPRLQADQPALDLSPGSTSLGRASDTELDVYLPSSIEMAKVTLQENLDLLHKVAAALLERETLTREDIETLSRGDTLPPRATGTGPLTPPVAPAPAVGPKRAAPPLLGGPEPSPA